MRKSLINLKNPVVWKPGQGEYTDQLKKYISKRGLYKMTWAPLWEFEPRKLYYSMRHVNPKTYQIQHCPHWQESCYWVPDQDFYRIPVPGELKDAYWIRDSQARRVQNPVQRNWQKALLPYEKKYIDFQELSFEKKHGFTEDEVIANLRKLAR